MKSLFSVLALTALPIGLSMAQTGPATQSMSTTKPASTTVAPNRQQELYDQYHGINKKTATPTMTPVATPTANRVDSQRPASVPTGQPVVTAKPDQSVTTTPVSPMQRVSAPGKPSGVRIGIRGGVTYPFYTEKITGVDPALGFVGGVVFNFGKGAVSFQPEVNYTRYNAKVNDFGFTNTIAADAIEVPLFLKFASGTYAGNRFFLNVGPYATYLASASINGKKESLNGSKGRFGFGAAAGIGLALKAGPGHVSIEVRGLYALGNTDSGFSTDSRTIFGQGTVGYSFPLGGR